AAYAPRSRAVENVQHGLEAQVGFRPRRLLGSVSAMIDDTKALSPHEAKILAAMKDGAERDLDAIAQATGLKLDQARSATESLKMKSLVELVREQLSRRAFLTDLGQKYLTANLPEIAIWKKISERGEATIAEAQDIPVHDKKTIGAAFGYLKQNGYLSV